MTIDPIPAAPPTIVDELPLFKQHGVDSLMLIRHNKIWTARCTCRDTALMAGGVTIVDAITALHNMIAEFIA